MAANVRTAAQLLRHAEGYRTEFEERDGTLWVRRGDRLPPALLATVRKRSAEIVPLLATRERRLRPNEAVLIQTDAPTGWFWVCGSEVARDCAEIQASEYPAISRDELAIMRRRPVEDWPPLLQCVDVLRGRIVA